MATYTVIEFNGDHLADLLQGDDPRKNTDEYLAHVLASIIRNPGGNAERLLQSCSLYRVMRVLYQNGDPTTSTQRMHLWRNPRVQYRPLPTEHLEKQVWEVLGDLEQLNMNLSSTKLQEITNKLRKAVREMTP